MANTPAKSNKAGEKKELPASGYFKKKVYTIKVSMPPIGTRVYNNLECVWYTVSEKDRFVLTGTRGEQWCIKPEKLAKTYKFATGQPINEVAINEYFIKQGRKSMNITTMPDNTLYYAEQVRYPQQFQVSTSWGAVLNGNLPQDPNTGKKIPHGKGDYRVCMADPMTGACNTSDCWIVNGAVMVDTYKVASPANKG